MLRNYRGDDTPTRRVTRYARFDSRLREEATAPPNLKPQPRGGFNSRLREEATRCFLPLRPASSRFNSRLREEATLTPEQREQKIRVSTHASVRRRPPKLPKDVYEQMFQLTPP